ncbi:MAG TPA: glutaredoxin family protein [Candidatus Dormibacteraeota bacterium]|nr:glutaredoxin family protein [Candidatus Dormibacteraeota bacterium]
MVDVVLVTRKGCHLCDDALRLLRELGVEPHLADVDADHALFQRYDWRVPVVLVDGVPAAEGLITRAQLLAVFGRSGGGPNAA